MKVKAQMRLSETEVRSRWSCTVRRAATLPASWEQLCPLCFPRQQVCRGSAPHLNNMSQKPPALAFQCHSVLFSGAITQLTSRLSLVLLRRWYFKN